jgi:hypothetical protein
MLATSRISTNLGTLPCELHYAEVIGRPGLAPGVYFRCLLIGYFEGISSERASPGGSSRTSWRVSTPDDAGGPLAGHRPASLDGSPWRARAGWARHDATRNAVPGARSSVHAPSAPVLTALTASRSIRSAVTISTSTGGDGFEGDPTRRVCSIRTFDYKDNETGTPCVPLTSSAQCVGRPHLLPSSDVALSTADDLGLTDR